MSEPNELSEKHVWLENNLASFLCESLNPEQEIIDVSNIILARLTPKGIDELFEFINDGFHAPREEPDLRNPMGELI